MKKFIAAFGTVLCLFMTSTSMVIHNNCEEKEECIKTESGTFNEDYLFLGNELDFSGDAEDLIFLGKRLKFSGKTKLGLISLCDKLYYSGVSGNGIITGGINILIDGTITGNSFIGSKSFQLSKNGSVNGNLFIGSFKLQIDGKLNGNLYTATGEIIINNEINGNVTAYGGRITIGENGKINGNLTYGTKEKLSKEDLSKITGVVKFDEKHKDDLEDWNSFVSFSKSYGFLIGIFLFLSFIAISSLLLFLPVFRKLDGKQPEKTFWRTSLWGIIPVLMYPAIIVLSFIFVITIPLAFILILAFIPLFFIAHIIGVTLIGKYIVTKFKWKIEKRHIQFLLGALAFTIFASIPFVSFFTFLFTSASGWGIYVSFLFNKNIVADES